MSDHTDVVAERNRLRAEVAQLQSIVALLRRDLAEANAKIALLQAQGGSSWTS